MLIALIIFTFILLAAFLFGVAIGRTGRDKLRADLANALREIGILKEANTGTQKLADEREEKYQHMREIAAEALKIAHKQEFPETISPEQHQRLERQFDFDRVKPNIVLPESKNCPACSVSVRSEVWPQTCPSCGCTFGFSEG